MTNVEGTTNTKEAQCRSMINIYAKYGFDINIIFASYIVWWIQTTQTIKGKVSQIALCGKIFDFFHQRVTL